MLRRDIVRKRLLLSLLAVVGLGTSAFAASDGPVTITGHVASNTLIDGRFAGVPVGAPVTMFFNTIHGGGFDPFWGPTGHFSNVDEVSFEMHVGGPDDERVSFSGADNTSLLFMNAGFVTTAVHQCVFEFFQMPLDSPGYSVYFKAQDEDDSVGWTSPLVCGLPSSTPSSAFDAASGSWYVQETTTAPVSPPPVMTITFDGALTFHPVLCGADFNQSGDLTVQDIFDYLNAWFAGCRGGTGDCAGRDADFNCSNTITVQDIFDFLTAWFAGC
jgi:hypothetical protein